MMELLNKTACAPISAVPSETVEKRSCPRFTFSPAVEVVDPLSDTRLKARLADISRNGCYVDTINPFARDSTVKVTITKDNLSFRTLAKVVYSNQGMGMGLLFTTAEPDQLQVLGIWLSELSGAEVAAQVPPKLSLQPDAPKSNDPELRKIITDLIALLNGKSILNDSEAMSFLRKLSK